jgi:hypothetical protein
VGEELHGLEATDKVDWVALADGGKYLKIGIAQTLDWDGSDRTLQLLQAKWKTCIAFAADGELRRIYPEHAALPWKIVLSCQTEPDERTKEFVRRADEMTRKEGGEFTIERQRETN